MIQPNFKLPLKTIHCDLDTEIKDSGTEIEGGIHITYLNGAFQPKDAEYIVHACNNYPKAIELLKEILESDTWQDGMRSSDFFTDKQIKEFLKQTQND